MTESERDAKYIQELEATIESQNKIIAELQEKLEPTSISPGMGIDISGDSLLTGQLNYHNNNVAIGYHPAQFSIGTHYCTPTMATEKFVEEKIIEEKKKLMDEVVAMFDKLKADSDE